MFARLLELAKARPPKGYVPVPKSRRGGWRKPDGKGGWTYWYPPTLANQMDMFGVREPMFPGDTVKPAVPAPAEAAEPVVSEPAVPEPAEAADVLPEPAVEIEPAKPAKPPTWTERIETFIRTLADPEPVRVSADLMGYMRTVSDRDFLRNLVTTLKLRLAKYPEPELTPRERRAAKKPAKKKRQATLPGIRTYSLRQLLVLAERRLAAAEAAAAAAPTDRPSWTPVSDPRAGRYHTGAWPYTGRDAETIFLLASRSPEDPERKPRPKGGQKDRTPHATWRRASKDPAKRDALKAQILEHLRKNTVPRTLNRLGVELFDQTGDMLFGTVVEDVLAELVEAGEVAWGVYGSGGDGRGYLFFQVNNFPKPTSPGLHILTPPDGDWALPASGGPADDMWPGQLRPASGSGREDDPAPEEPVAVEPVAVEPDPKPPVEPKLDPIPQVIADHNAGPPAGLKGKDLEDWHMDMHRRMAATISAIDAPTVHGTVLSPEMRQKRTKLTRWKNAHYKKADALAQKRLAAPAPEPVAVEPPAPTAEVSDGFDDAVWAVGQRVRFQYPGPVGWKTHEGEIVALRRHPRPKLSLRPKPPIQYKIKRTSGPAVWVDSSDVQTLAPAPAAPEPVAVEPPAPTPQTASQQDAFPDIVPVGPDDLRGKDGPLLTAFFAEVAAATDDQLEPEHAYELMRGKIRAIARQKGWSVSLAGTVMRGHIILERKKRGMGADVAGSPIKYRPKPAPEPDPEPVAVEPAQDTKYYQLSSGERGPLLVAFEEAVAAATDDQLDPKNNYELMRGKIRAIGIQHGMSDRQTNTLLYGIIQGEIDKRAMAARSAAAKEQEEERRRRQQEQEQYADVDPFAALLESAPAPVEPTALTGRTATYTSPSGAYTHAVTIRSEPDARGMVTILARSGATTKQPLSLLKLDPVAAPAPPAVEPEPEPAPAAPAAPAFEPRRVVDGILTDLARDQFMASSARVNQLDNFLIEFRKQLRAKFYEAFGDSVANSGEVTPETQRYIDEFVSVDAMVDVLGEGLYRSLQETPAPAPVPAAPAPVPAAPAPVPAAPAPAPAPPEPPVVAESEMSDEAQSVKARIERLEKDQARMKAANRVVRAKRLDDEQKVAKLVADVGLSEEAARALLQPDFAGRTGYPRYRLTNNNANIRRLKERLKTLMAESARETADYEFAGGTVTDNSEADRIQIFFDQKPPVEIRTKLKRSGWRWAPSEGAWQRKRTDNARFSATQILEGLSFDTPVEPEPAPAPAPAEVATDARPEATSPTPTPITTVADPAPAVPTPAPVAAPVAAPAPVPEPVETATDARPEATSPTPTPIAEVGEQRQAAAETAMRDVELDAKVTAAMAKKRTKGQRREANDRAWDVISRVLSTGGKLTDAERVIVGEYSGIGGIGADLNQYHTRTDIAQAVWGLVTRHVQGDLSKALEPACGTGVFLQTRPPDAKIEMTAADIDYKSATVAQLLHTRDDVRHQSFEEFSVSRVGQQPEFDAVITNAPFCTRTGGVARLHKPRMRSADRYFVDTSLDHVRAGGVVAMVIHAGVLNSTEPAAKEFRERLLARAEIVDAYRLPTEAFAHTHAAVVSDVIVLRKRDERVAQTLLQADDLDAVLGAFDAYDEPFVEGTFFDAHPERVLGTALTAEDTNWRSTVTGDAEAVAGKIKELGTAPPANPGRKTVLFEQLEELAEKNDAVRELVAQGMAQIEQDKPPVLGETRMIGAIKYLYIGDPPRWQMLESVTDVAQIVQQSADEAIILAHDISERIQYLQQVVKEGDFYKARAIRRRLQERVLAWVADYGLPAEHRVLSELSLSAPALLDFIASVGSNGGLSDLLSKDIPVSIQAPEMDKTSVESVAAAYAAANEGHVTTAEIAATWTGAGTGTDLPRERARKALQKLGTYAYRGPGRWQHDEDYLTGDLYELLEAETGRLATVKEPWEKDALERQLVAIRERIDAQRKGIDDIDLQLRTSSWLPDYVWEGWLNSPEMRRHVGRYGWEDKHIHFRVVQGIYQMGVERTISPGTATERTEIQWTYDGNHLFKYLNRQSLGKESQDKIRDLREHVQVLLNEWIRDNEYRQEVEDLYNRLFRNNARKQYSGAPLGIAPAEYDADGKVTKVGMGHWSRPTDRVQELLRERGLAWRKRDRVTKELSPTGKGRVEALDDASRPLTDAERAFVSQHADEVVPDLENPIAPHDYQNETVRWAMQQGSGVLALDVGLGKTFAAICLARLLKQQGKARRPFCVVPKSVATNWAREVETLTPGARVLVVGEHEKLLKAGQRILDRAKKENRELTAEERRKVKDYTRVETDSDEDRNRKLAQIKQNEYDLIICTNSAFQRIPLKEATIQEYSDTDFAQQRARAIDALQGKSPERRAKALAKMKAAWGAQLAGKVHDKAMDVVYWEDLGIDCLMADEAHAYKNLHAAKVQGFGQKKNPKFLGGSQESVQAHKMQLRARHVRAQSPDNGVYFLTATPSKNSPLEIYNMLQHIAPEEFSRIGIRNVDEFVDRYCQIEERPYLHHTTGEIDTGPCVVGFNNLSELEGILDKYMMVRTAGDVGLKIPETQRELVAVDMTDEQKDIYVELRKEAETLNAKEEPGGVFRISGKMAKVSQDLSLYDPEAYPDWSANSPKYKACVERVMQGTRERGGQIVFVEHKAIHQTLKKLLIEAGLKPEEIAIINGDVAKSSLARQEIGDRFNSGEVKVVIGNSSMEEGVNLQGKKHDVGTTDIHHLDQAYDPGTMHQREGRAIRQGNPAEAVKVHTYVSRGSFDGFKYETMKGKEVWLQQLLRSVRSGVDSIANEQMSGINDAHERMIMMSADPEAEREKYEAQRLEAMTTWHIKQAEAALVDWGKLQALYARLPRTKDTDKLQLSIDRLERKLERSASLPEEVKAYVREHGSRALPAMAVMALVGEGDDRRLKARLIKQGDVIERPHYTGGAKHKYVVVKVDAKRQTLVVRPWGTNANTTVKVTEDEDLSTYESSTAALEDELRESLESTLVSYRYPVEAAEYVDGQILEAHRPAIEARAREWLAAHGTRSVVMVEVDGQARLVPVTDTLPVEKRRALISAKIQKLQQDEASSSYGGTFYTRRIAEEKAELDKIPAEDGPLTTARILMPWGRDVETITEMMVEHGVGTTTTALEQLLGPVRRSPLALSIQADATKRIARRKKKKKATP